MRGVTVLLIGLLMATACNPAQRLAKKCAETFPCQNDTLVEVKLVNDTIIEPWLSVEYIDTTICPPSEDTLLLIREIVKQLPPRTIVRQRLDTVTLIETRDAAELIALRARVNEVTRDRDKMAKQLSKQKRNWFWPFIICALLLVVVLAVRFRSRLRG